MSDVIKLSRPVRNARVMIAAAPRASVPDLPRMDAAPLWGTTPDFSPAVFQAAADEKKLRDQYEAGYSAGWADSEARMREQFEAITVTERQNIGALIASVGEQALHMQQQMERRVIEFALAIAERIVKHEIDAGSDLIIRQVREALRRLVGVDRIKIRIHPDDEAAVRAGRASFLAANDSVRDMVLESDPTVRRGGCVIESASGNVDAQLSTQLDRMKAALIESLEQAG